MDYIYLTQYQFGESLWSCEGGNGTVRFIKGKECLHWLRDRSFSKIIDASDYLYNEQKVSNIMRLSHIHISRNIHSWNFSIDWTHWGRLMLDWECSVRHAASNTVFELEK